MLKHWPVKKFREKWFFKAFLSVFLSVRWQQRMSPEIVLTLLSESIPVKR